MELTLTEVGEGHFLTLLGKVNTPPLPPSYTIFQSTYPEQSTNMADAIDPIHHGIEVFEGQASGERRTNIRGYVEYGLAVIDHPTREERGREGERPWLSSEDKAAKRRAEEFVQSEERWMV